MNSFEQISRDLIEISNKDIFFIVGAIKSGTTWLQHILNGHPEISCKGEGHIVNELIPKVMTLLTEHNNLIHGKNKMLNQESNGYPKFNSVDARYLAKTLLYTLLKSQIDKTGVRIIGEKTPNTIFHMQEVIERLVPQAKFIHIIRDGRDCAVSGWHHIYRDTPVWAKETFPTFQQYASNYAKNWQRQITIARQFGFNHPARYLEVQYELMHSQPDEQIKRILDFLNADSEEAMIDYCKEAGSFQKLSHGRSRGEENLSSHFRKGVVGDWQALFDDISTQQFKTHAGKLLEELGYSW